MHTNHFNKNIGMIRPSSGRQGDRRMLLAVRGTRMRAISSTAILPQLSRSLWSGSRRWSDLTWITLTLEGTRKLTQVCSRRGRRRLLPWLRPHQQQHPLRLRQPLRQPNRTQFFHDVIKEKIRLVYSFLSQRQLLQYIDGRISQVVHHTTWLKTDFFG